MCLFSFKQEKGSDRYLFELIQLLIKALVFLPHPECLFMHIYHQSLVPKRSCAFEVRPLWYHRYSAAGLVMGSKQLCKKTQCCVGIYQVIDYQLKVNTLACNVVKKTCLEETCDVQLPLKSQFISCICRTDMCNRNISLISEPERPPKPRMYAAGTNFKAALVVVVVVVVILFVSVFIIIGIKWRSKEKTNTGIQSEAPENQITDIELQEVLGRGQFATVYQGNYGRSVVAVKVYPANWKHRYFKEKEVYELPMMKHERITEFLGTGRKADDGSLLIVLQYAEYGSLHSFLCKHTSSWMLSMKLCQTLSEGLSYLHSDLSSNDMHKPAVAHGDLSSSNVLVRADGTCVLCDFESSTILRSCSGHQLWQDHFTNMQGHPQFCTLNYMSPEILESTVDLRSSSFRLQGDIYALGLILWEIWMRCFDLFKGGDVPQHLLPYELELEANVTLERLIFHVSEMNRRPSVPENWGPALKELLTDCWDQDTDARLTAPCVLGRLMSL
ncbi:bone morphogenetic protein receptor type-2 isoform X2 [Fundulus heteroclitus]|uniref:bone morphogenetic protein receptor type-2 isoform X2 n=1 Tax=Fundulus heteroclitus TaxID=8078 RepID=UPI00165A40E7|nr:bone morphogenetic protein receptor type-2 isoform X2 [Fundulus heteroclitus]